MVVIVPGIKILLKLLGFVVKTMLLHEDVSGESLDGEGYLYFSWNYFKIIHETHGQS